MNSLVKNGYVNNTPSVHKFAKSFLEILGHTIDNEANERYYSQVCNGRYEKNVTKSLSIIRFVKMTAEV